MIYTQSDIYFMRVDLWIDIYYEIYMFSQRYTYCLIILIEIYWFPDILFDREIFYREIYY